MGAGAAAGIGHAGAAARAAVDARGGAVAGVSGRAAAGARKLGAVHTGKEPGKQPGKDTGGPAGWGAGLVRPSPAVNGARVTGPPEN